MHQNIPAEKSWSITQYLPLNNRSFPQIPCSSIGRDCGTKKTMSMLKDFFMLTISTNDITFLH